MDEPLPVEMPEPVEVVTVVDAQNVLSGVAASEDARLSAIESGLSDIALRIQADDGDSTEGVVTVDAGQWSELRTNLDDLRGATSVGLFLTLLILCVVSAVLGTRIWSTFSEGWRHG